MKITGRTRLIGIIGHPVDHTLSPILQNAALAETGLDYCYFPFDVRPRELGKALLGLKALGCRGLNVTIPHKQAVVPLLDGLSREARLMGAVNTIEFRGRRLIGHNTDGRGFVRAFEEEIGESPKNRCVMILGAGGAGRAVAVQLLIEGVNRLWVANRTIGKAQRLIRVLRSQFPGKELIALPLKKDRLMPHLPEIEILINATSVGMGEDRSPMPAELLRPGGIVCDLVYHPPETTLLRLARAAGARTLQGVGMLVWQGALSFEIWTGKAPPIGAMKQALMESLGGRPFG